MKIQSTFWSVCFNSGSVLSGLTMLTDDGQRAAVFYWSLDIAKINPVLSRPNSLRFWRFIAYLREERLHIIDMYNIVRHKIFWRIYNESNIGKFAESCIFCRIMIAIDMTRSKPILPTPNISWFHWIMVWMKEKKLHFRKMYNEWRKKKIQQFRSHQLLWVYILRSV